jgi:hypothetical protein
MTRHDSNEEPTDGVRKGSGNIMDAKCRRQRRSNWVLDKTVSAFFKPCCLRVPVISQNRERGTSQGIGTMLRDDQTPELLSFWKVPCWLGESTVGIQKSEYEQQALTVVVSRSTRSASRLSPRAVHAISSTRQTKSHYQPQFKAWDHDKSGRESCAEPHGR